jgi:hypothetical protein
MKSAIHIGGKLRTQLGFSTKEYLNPKALTFPITSSFIFLDEYHFFISTKAKNIILCFLFSLNTPHHTTTIKPTFSYEVSHAIQILTR